MRILFLGRRYLYFRNFESVIADLAARGHQVHLAVERDDTEGSRPPFIDELTTRYPAITCGYAPSRGDDDWSWVAGRLRLGLDYLRYLHPLFDTAVKLRHRARERTPNGFVWLGGVLQRAPWLVRPMIGLVRWLERTIPAEPAIRSFLAGHAPDAILITPLIDLGSSQIEYLREARSLRIPTALCVWSWDHLSSKALVRELPDRVVVWNETQKREAIELHDVPADRIVVTGAQCFDQWFDRSPSRDRQTFCAHVGLPAHPRYILYVCSALFLGSPPEAPFVCAWIARVRADPRLRDVPILVRPHPSRLREWEGIDVAGLTAVAIRGGNPIDAAAKADYFDALFYSGAVVGLNTSAFIEAGIVGRPVHTIMLPEHRDNQSGTLHFRYLQQAGGGLLQVADTFDEHLTQLAGSLARQTSEVLPFVREFVRPHGLTVAATPLFVRTVEALPQIRVAVARPPRGTALGRRVLAALSARRFNPRSERWLYSVRELEVLARQRRDRERKAEREADVRARGDVERAAKRARRNDEWARHRAARAVADAEKKAVRSR